MYILSSSVILDQVLVNSNNYNCIFSFIDNYIYINTMQNAMVTCNILLLLLQIIYYYIMYWNDICKPIIWILPIKYAQKQNKLQEMHESKTLTFCTWYKISKFEWIPTGIFPPMGTEKSIKYVDIFLSKGMLQGSCYDERCCIWTTC